MKHPSPIEWLQQLPRLGGAPGLDRMRQLMQALGNPQKELKVIHLAGTNGKGTTATLTANILRCAGYKTGLTISPYVLEFRERFQINGEMIDTQELEQLAQEVYIAAQSLPQLPVQFEAVTAVALLWFARSHCDFAVLETGLGGRWDATNVVDNTLVAAILRIDLDHTQLLGDTLGQIAAEKAGIIKPGCTVVEYPLQDQEAQQEIVAACIRNQAELVQPQLEDLELEDAQGRLECVFSYGGYWVRLPFLGAHQACNATVAIEIALALWRKGYEISDQAIQTGLETARLPARIEVIRQTPPLLLDGCHNPAGAAALAGTLERYLDRPVAGVVGVLADKAVEEMVRCLAPCLSRVYAVTPHCPRAMEAEQLAELIGRIRPELPVEVCSSLEQAINKGRDCPEGLVVCGSLYLASEARSLLKN